MTMVAGRGSAAAGSRTGGWVLVAALYGYAAWYALCLCLALARAADLAGHWYLPSANDVYTANADVNAGWTWSTPVLFTVPTAPLVAGLGLFVVGMLAVLGRTRHRRPLLGGVAALVLVMVVSLTTAGQSLAGWLID
ncbi:hypothetical protein BJY16_004838 [Actinoplanes octamycinicus]|uniref:Uncharacterized protein n=1 Tax=Actinoplanes octamycinicus TaxID=135948 RepID=A0A7W7M8X4_9ACTN|nr:hypothetical protein [Actinoplanes octamycinicus]MBB4741379.1 hypothetical protein [Actinoplanes octamycinicus]GIE62823.1 hypothetical protein Aoc01nite_82250 [Actinoplanes octamycinicus]